MLCLGIVSAIRSFTILATQYHAKIKNYSYRSIKPLFPFWEISKRTLSPSARLNCLVVNVQARVLLLPPHLTGHALNTILNCPFRLLIPPPWISVPIKRIKRVCNYLGFRQLMHWTVRWQHRQPHRRSQRDSTPNS